MSAVYCKKFNWIGYPQNLYKRAERIDGGQFRLYRTPDGNEYPSVTTVVGFNKDHSALDKWRAAVGDEEANATSKRALRRGRTLHAMAEEYARGDLADTANKYSLIDHDDFKAFARTMNDFIDNIVAVELPMYSDRIRMAGTVDMIAEYEGKLSIIDFKTASDVRFNDEITSYFEQLTAYSIMASEMLQLNIDDGVIVMNTHDYKTVQYKIKVKDYHASLRNARRAFFTQYGI